METIREYVINNYHNESCKSIGEKFGVNSQSVSHVVRRLHKEGILTPKTPKIIKEVSVTPIVKVKMSRKEYAAQYYQKHKERLNELNLGSRHIRNKDKKISNIGEVVFNNHNGNGKRECRKLVSEYIGNVLGRNPKILTLPCNKWLWEKEVLQNKPESKFVGVEYNNDVYNKMVKHYTEDSSLQKSVISMYNCPMSEVISRTKTEEYSHMILDYCGVINSFEDEIEEVLTRDLVKVEGIISITLSKTGRCNGIEGKTISNTLKSIPKSMITNGMTDSEFSTRQSIIRMVLNTKGRYSIIDFLDYNDTGGQGMMLFVLQRVK